MKYCLVNENEQALLHMCSRFFLIYMSSGLFELTQRFQVFHCWGDGAVFSSVLGCCTSSLNFTQAKIF